jgi:hypothetical protein
LVIPKTLDSLRHQLSSLIFSLGLLVSQIASLDGIVPVTGKTTLGTALAATSVSRGNTCVDIFEKIVRARTNASTCE